MKYSILHLQLPHQVASRELNILLKGKKKMTYEEICELYNSKQIELDEALYLMNKYIYATGV